MIDNYIQKRIDKLNLISVDAYSKNGSFWFCLDGCNANEIEDIVEDLEKLKLLREELDSAFITLEESRKRRTNRHEQRTTKKET